MNVVFVMAGRIRVKCAGPVMVREAARRVSRDVNAVYTDLSAHLSACILSRTETGQEEFLLQAA